ncbi:MAG: response regulator transcription factor [Tidjanibacter sp.]|nr:response regulator transcription factor [Tidjanibacter sp.]
MDREVCRVLLADDHRLFREGLRGLLSVQSGIEVVGVAADGAELVSLTESVEYDVALIDIEMPVMNGLEAAEKILASHPEARLVALTMHNDEAYYYRMVELGVKGFLLKNSDIDEVVCAVREVCAGGSYFSQELLDSLVSNLKESQVEAEPLLSEREMEVLPLICQGLSNQEIADKLFISKRTVDNHRANIIEKSGCKNTAGMVVWAIKNGLVELE